MRPIPPLSSEYVKKVEQRLKLLHAKPDFQNHVSLVQKRKIDNYYETPEKFHDAIRDILEKQKLPTHWFNYIMHYVLQDQFITSGAFIDPDGPIYSIGYGEVEGIETFVNTDTQIKKEAGLNIKKVGRTRIKRTFDRDLAIRMAADNGATISDIQKLMKEKYKQDLKESYIRSIITIQRDKADIPKWQRKKMLE